MRTHGKELLIQALPGEWNVVDVFFVDIYNSWDGKARFYQRNSVNKDVQSKYMIPFVITNLIGIHNV